MIDLRKEMDILLGNRWDSMIIRVMTNTKCFCWRKRSQTADPECPNCEGSGYVFNEHLSKCKAFHAPSFSISHAQDFDYGESYSNTYVLYFEVDAVSESINIGDEVYEIKVNTDGSIADPIKRIRKWKVIDPYNLNLDNGKLEFIKVFAKPMVV